MSETPKKPRPKRTPKPASGTVLGDYEIVAEGHFEDADDDAAEEGTERRIGAFPNPSLEECPVVPLGFSAGFVHFAMPEGEIRREMASKIAGMLKTDIFACAAGQAFLTNWRDTADKFQRDLCAVWFNRACRAQGKFDTRRSVRSLGVWNGRAGEVVLHKGDALWRFDLATLELEVVSVAAALRERSGPLYRLEPPAVAPRKPGATMCDGQWVRATLDLWRHEPIGRDGLTGADVVAGFLMAALLGAVPSFRVHVLLHALHGSGKTAFLEFVHAALSALSGDLTTSLSDAGFRGDISGMARPIVMDEVEAVPAGGAPGPIDKMLDVLMHMATGAGATRKQGDMAGGVVTQTAIGSVIMGAITPPALSPAMASRVMEIKLLPLAAPAPPGDAAPTLATGDELRDLNAKARELSPALLWRAITGAGRFKDDFTAVKDLLTSGGDPPRTADLVATLAAGRRLLLFDAPMSADEAAAEVEVWRPVLKERAREAQATNEGADAFAHLMSADAGITRSDGRPTLGDVLNERLLNNMLKREDVLRNHGLRTHVEPDGSRWLLVSNDHPALTAIFAKTVWQDWRRSLGYLDQMGPAFAVKHPPNPHRFGFKKSRCTAIPLTPWLEEPSAAGTVRDGGYNKERPADDVDW